MSIRCEKVICDKRDCIWNCQLDRICLNPSEIHLHITNVQEVCFESEGMTEYLECAEYEQTK